MADALIEHKGRMIRDEIRTSATPQQIWEAWTDPQKIAQWFTDKASGSPEVGSTFTWTFERFGYVIPYEVLAAEPGKRFALRWSGAGRPPGILEITIERHGGETLVRLVNSGFQEGAEWDEDYEGVVSGWHLSLATLKHCLENYFGEPRASFLALRPAKFSYEQLQPYFHDGQRLAQWLTVSGGIGKPGELCELVLRDGELDGARATGQVLAATRREVAIAWQQIRGVLELKAFSMGPGGRMVGVRGFGWKLDAARANEIEQHMEKAVERLAAVLEHSAAGAAGS